MVRPMDKRDEAFAENVLKKLVEKRWSQKELADKVGVTIQAINRIVNKHNAASRSSTTAIAKAFECTEDELFIPTMDQIVKPSPTLLEVLDLLNAYQNASDEERATVMSLLTDDLEYMHKYPRYARFLRAFNFNKERR